MEIRTSEEFGRHLVPTRRSGRGAIKGPELIFPAGYQDAGHKNNTRRCGSPPPRAAALKKTICSPGPNRVLNTFMDTRRERTAAGQPRRPRRSRSHPAQAAGWESI